MKSNKNGLWKTNLQIVEVDHYPEISTDIQSTLDRLMGFDANNEQFNLLLCDSDGRLLVSTSATQGASAVNSAPVVGVATTILLAANLSRKIVYIFNNGTSPIFVTYGVPATLALGFPIAPGGAFIEDRYLGAINAISSIAGQDTRVVEI